MKNGISENKTVTIPLNQCFECGDTSTPIHQHHVIPRSKGGTKTIPLCETCHGIVHNTKFLHNSKLISESIQDKKRDGKKYTKNTPIGYELVGDELVENQEEIKLISRIRNLNSRGHSYQQIADKLNKEGITTKQGKTWNRNYVYHYAKKNTREIVKEEKESIKEQQTNFHKFFKL